MGKDKKLLRKCPICLNETGQVLHHQSFEIPENYPLPSEYDVVCCLRCGFVFADTSATQEDHNRFYKDFSKYEFSSRGLKTTSNWTWDRLKAMTKYLPNKNVSILDVGCANGGLLVWLKKLGYKNLSGLDVPKRCIENARKQGANAFQGNLFSIDSDIPDKKFDFITFTHVLEHIYDLRKAVNNLVGKLNEKGILYVETPNASRFAEYYFSPFSYFDVEHINHFDKNSLKNLFLQKNLDLLELVEDETRVSNKTYPVIYASYQKQESFKTRDVVVSYIKKSRQNNKWPEINKLAKTQEEVAIRGIGGYTMQLLKNTSLGKCNITLLIDRDKNKEGMKVKGIPISCSLEKLRTHQGPIVVCTAIWQDDVLKEIKDMKLNNRVIVMK